LKFLLANFAKLFVWKLTALFTATFEYQKAKESFLSKKPQLQSTPGEKYPSRESLYD
jgi:hypothetical protein